MRWLYMMMVIHIALAVTPTHLHTHQNLMYNLDYYDNMEWKQTYCEDTLFAFGAEDYLNVPVLNTEFTKMESNYDSTIAMALAKSLRQK